VQIYQGEAILEVLRIMDKLLDSWDWWLGPWGNPPPGRWPLVDHGV